MNHERDWAAIRRIDAVDVQWEPSFGPVRPIRFQWTGRVRAFVLEHPQGPILIDTGVVEAEADFRARLAELPRPPVLLLLTHGHWDHAGGVAAVRKAYGCPVLCHELEVQRVQKETGVAVDQVFRDDTEPVPGLKVIHVPGHTEGNCAFFLQHERILFSGDVIFGKGSIAGNEPVNLPPEEMSLDWKGACANLSKLRSLDFDCCMMSHGEHLPASARAQVLALIDRLG